MVNFVPYHSNMQQDFELYSNRQEQQPDFNQPFLPASTYSMEQTFSAPFDNMASLEEVPRHLNLQYHFDTMAQEVKAFQYQTPAGSPHSTSHSYHDLPPVLSASSESGASVSSSTTGSPPLHPHFDEPWGLALTSSFDYPAMIATDKTFVDPTLIQPFTFPSYTPYLEIPSPFLEVPGEVTSYFPIMDQPPSPALSHVSSQSQQQGSARFKRGSVSPYLRTQQYQPYPQFNDQRRGSIASLHSHNSSTSRKSVSSFEVDDETREKGRCPLLECGRIFKDLKAHMLTHQNERPMKCPITTCEYHVKGFARKYDKNRHTLTHYKGTMVCGFCPGSGSAVEKSFNRADVFKRHLTSVHGVEQNPPNSRRKSPSGRKAYTSTMLANVSGTCSTCSVTFANAQEFYEHLDDCVLRVVQQADPSEAINQRLLTSVAEDKDVSETLDRNGLSKSIEYSIPSYNDNEDEEEEEEMDNEDYNDDTYGVRRPRSGKGTSRSAKSS
ncbi:hypothetical protein P153DRAFT_285742 [Dothidotthia symphoricarpi CBS 119687]|uniref:C2H2-type domain-containing protein n=1 Tax=Dothidotthia symphoricarpi CBS 119687 TaxID=1392245 RepID=A0A6A6AMK0_9PLEO|nr:uncharacterized protein P153DRAFT_285742 [Dothidotthia symphoricarpi CBS 119687]KAF2132315.1 hypothetical protein P153DRAFT_285742 [Dothidotthia symphoricarpi CBS 119687]